LKRRKVNMDFEEYQKKSHSFATYPVITSRMVYPLLGLAGETGELLEKMKKLFRDQEGRMDMNFRNSIARELGDVLWYLSEVATLMDLKLPAIAEQNIEKLSFRKEKGILKGSGDYRGEEKGIHIQIGNRADDVEALKEKAKLDTDCKGKERSAIDRQVGGSHYKGLPIQPVEYIQQNELSFLQGCIIKRISRYDLKGGDGIKDLEKIKHEVNLLIEFEKGEEENEKKDNCSGCDSCKTMGKT